MRAFGRSCRGQGKVLVYKVRETEGQLLDVGQMVGPLALKAALDLYEDHALEEAQQARLMASLREAVQHYDLIEQQSRRLIQGKKLPHAKIVNAYDSAIVPIIKGKSNGPVQFDGGPDRSGADPRADRRRSAVDANGTPAQCHASEDRLRLWL